MRVFRPFTKLLVPAVLVACGAWAAGEEAPAEGVEKWLKELGDEKYAVREAAHHALWQRGVEVLPRLRELAAVKEDPERMLRARDLIRKIEFEITPDSDPKLVEWVEQYESASLPEKERILGQMKSKRAWFPMLRLYHSEKDAAARVRLRPAVDGVAVVAAREKWAAGDVESARMALEMAPVDASSLLALAVFHRARGAWQEVWDKMDEKERTGPMGLAMLRAAGRVGEARAVAAELGEVKLAAWLAALEGDPLDWMDTVNADMDDLEKEYLFLAKRRWRGEELKAADLERMVRRANGRDRSARMGAIQALFLLAQPSLAEPAFTSHAPLAAFAHFEQLEKVSKALAALGLDPEKPDYASWFRSKLDAYKKDDIEDQRGVNEVPSELVAMAGFLESKGLDGVLWDAFSEPLLQYAKEDEMEFLNLLSMMFGGRRSSGGSPLFSVRVAEKWAADKEERWADVMTSALGEEGDVRVWWDWLGEQKPALGFADRLRAQLAIYRVGADPAGLRERWVAQIRKLAKVDPEWAKRTRQLAMETEDADLFLAAEDGMDEESREGLFWGARIHHLSALERWGDVAGVIERHIERQKKGGRVYVSEMHAHAYLAAALRLAGREKQAKAHDAMAESLYLGDPAYALRIGYGYALGRDYARAMLWWKRACVEGDAEFSEFSKAVKVLADGWLEQGEWLRAASMYECMARLYMYSDYRWETPLLYTSYRLHADTARAVSRLKADRAGAIAALERCHASFVTDGALADVFFPSLRRAGLKEEHDRMFDKTWAAFREVIARYPEADNTRNTAAWMSSRAIRNLAEGMEDAKAALARRPGQAAYLDTMAELYFAMGNRAESVKKSTLAMLAKPDDLMIRRQHARFLLDPLPK